MPTPTLIQQQRNLLRQFRADNRLRTKTEADAETRRKAEIVALQTELTQIRQIAAAQLTAAQKAKEEAHALLTGANLPRLLGKALASRPIPHSDTDPSEEFRRAVAVVTNTAQNMPALLNSLTERRKSDAVRTQLLIFLTIVAGIAIFMLGYQWQQTRLAYQTQATAAAQTKATSVTLLQVQATATAVTIQAQATTTVIAVLAQATVLAKAPELKPLIERFGIQFVEVPGGEFSMGSPPGEGSIDEHPRHTVVLDTYWIGLTEVTNAQYRPFVETGGYSQPEWWTENGWSWRQSNRVDEPKYWDNTKWNASDQPVIGVNWYEATAYTRWLTSRSGVNTRLPTEAEWEKAACGSDERTYPWGNQEPTSELANFNKNFRERNTSVVGIYLQGISAYRALDMAGNVWELTNSLYKDYPYQTNDGREDTIVKGLRIQRGGSATSPRFNLRCADRYSIDENLQTSYTGFRILAIAH